jgi:thiol-disulfide isomerase/thioredoxin
MGLARVDGSHTYLAALLLLLTGFCGACSDSSRYPPLKIKVGQAVPSLALVDRQQQPVTVTTATGKLLVINLWATWCAPCRHELPSLDQLAKVLGEKQASVIGISVDRDSHVWREYLAERQLGFANFRDADRRIADGIIGIHVYPTTLIVGPQGTLLKVVQGWRKWDSPEMVAQMRALIPTSQTGK